MKEIITARSVINDLPPNHFPFPNSFFTLNRKLPAISHTVIMIAASAAVEGNTKNSVIEEIELLLDMKNDPYIIDFDNPRTNFKSEEEREDYEYEFKREMRVKQLLELNGYKYPRNTEDVVDLLIKLGLIFEEKKDGKTFVDVLISPYPKVRELFKQSN